MRQQQRLGRAPRRVLQFLCCAACAVLPACLKNGPDAPFESYVTVLGAALSTATPTLQATRSPPVPAVAEWHVEHPANAIARLDILEVSGCAVQANIGRRQTSLGRAAKPSQRLLLELEYLRQAPACIDRLRGSGNDGLSALLAQAWHETQARLPTLIFNATLGSAEYRALWLTTPAPGEYPRVSPALANAALAGINGEVRRWLDGDYDAHNRALELMLSEVAGGDAGTQLQHWTRQIDWLATADNVIERQLARDALCSADTPGFAWLTARLRYQFTDVIRPLTTQAQQRYLLITTPIATLETQLRAALPARYRQWMENRQQHVAKLSRAPYRHLELLNRARQACAYK